VGLPSVSDPTCVADNASLLPTVLVLKNGGRSAQIVWDGGIDKPMTAPTSRPTATAFR